MDQKKFCPVLYPKGKEMDKTWFVLYKDQAGRKQKKYGNLNNLPTVELRLAEANRLIQDLVENPIFYNKRLDTDIIQHMQHVLDDRRHTISYRSYLTYHNLYIQFAKWYRLNPDQDPSRFLYYLLDQGKHQNYVKKHQVFLKMVFTDLLRRRIIAVNPFEHIKIRGVKKQSLLPFHPAQVIELSELIQPADPNLWLAIELMYYCFFRPAELRKLQVKHILFHAMMIDVDSKMTKDKDSYQKAIPLQLQAKILTLKTLPKDWYLFGKKSVPGPVMAGKNDLWSRHRLFLNKLGYDSRYGLYGWVHTGIKQAILAGVPAKQVQLQKGHSNLQILDQYLKHVGVAESTQLINNFPDI